MTLRPLIALVVKDLLLFFTDRYSVVLAFGAPIALASFMAIVFGGNGSSQPARIEVRLVDEGDGTIAAELLAASPRCNQLRLKKTTQEEALDDVRHSRAVMAVILPAGFGGAASRAIHGEAPFPAVTIVRDPTRPSEVSLGRGLLARLILEVLNAETENEPAAALIDELTSATLHSNATDPSTDDSIERAEFLRLIPGIEGSEGDEATASRDELLDTFPGLDELFDEPTHDSPSGGDGTLPFLTRERSIVPGGPRGEQAALAAHAFAGMVVQFVLFSAVEWGVALLLERQRGIWKRLRASSIPWFTLMTSKVIGCSVISLLITVVVFGVGSILFRFGVNGSAIAFSLLVLSFSWASANFGLVVAALGKTPQGARSVAVMAVLFLVMLGGGWIPTFLFPQWLQALTPVIPTRWAIDGFDGVFSRHYGLAEVLPLVGYLTAFGGVCSMGAFFAYRCSEPV